MVGTRTFPRVRKFSATRPIGFNEINDLAAVLGFLYWQVLFIWQQTDIVNFFCASNLKCNTL